MPFSILLRDSYKPTELAYMAGMVDADGSVQARLTKSNALSIEVHVYNNSIDLMEWLKWTFGGSYRDVNRKAREGNPQWSPVYTWRAGGAAARDLLEMIAPYMIVKRAQAELAVAGWDRRDPNYRNRVVPAEVIVQRQEVAESMKELNQAPRGAPNHGVFVRGA